MDNSVVSSDASLPSSCASTPGSGLQNALLRIAQLLFETSDDFTALARTILLEAKAFVGCDRTSLLLVEDDNRFTPFAVSHDGDCFTQLKIPIEGSLAGHALTSQESVNVPEARDDPRWHAESDVATNYHTKSLLAVPIYNAKKKPLAVISFLNKSVGSLGSDIENTSEALPFSEQDVENAKAFALFAGLALDKSITISKMVNSKRHLAIVLEVMSYHLRAPPEVVDAFMLQDFPVVTSEEYRVGGVEWDPHPLPDSQLVRATFRMFWDLGFISQTDETDARILAQFLLTTARNYRSRKDVAYHNFSHAVCVTHALYLLARDFGLRSLLDETDIFAMLVACICHDLDHRGQSNNFQKLAHTPLYALYARSTLEAFHANFALKIIGSEGHDVFNHLDAVDYQSAISILRDAILSTDLANFFANQAALQRTLAEGQIGRDHTLRSALRGMIMNAADLSASYKDFGSAQHVTTLVYKEFFDEGHGLKNIDPHLPLHPDMDGANEARIPALQVSFLDKVVIPIYELQAKALPETIPLLERVRETRESWKRLADQGIEYQLHK